MINSRKKKRNQLMAVKVNPDLSQAIQVYPDRIRVNGFYETFSYVNLGNGAFCQRIVIIIWVHLLLKLTLNEEFNMTTTF